VKTFARTDEATCPTGLNGLIEDTLKLTAPMYRRRVSVETQFGAIPEIDCYPGLISQVFLNLVTNAAQAIEGEGKITIRTWCEGAFIHAAVSDNGRGIRPEDRAKIFQRGYTTKPVGEGTGLGLAFCKDVVEQRHGGSLTFESEVGVGTTFRMSLPIKRTNNDSGD
jgi:signal transduction histidine kinase